MPRRPKKPKPSKKRPVVAAAVLPVPAQTAGVPAPVEPTALAPTDPASLTPAAPPAPPEPTTDEAVDTELTREEFVDEWKTLTEGEADADQDHDKTVLTLSTGALAATVAFYGHLVKGTPMFVEVQVLAWIFFIAASICTLASFRTSKWAFQRRRDILVAIYQREAGAREQGNRWDAVTEAFNFLSGIFLASGLISWGYFAYQNLIK